MMTNVRRAVLAALALGILAAALLLIYRLVPAHAAPAVPPQPMPGPGQLIGEAGAHAAVRVGWDLQ